MSEITQQMWNELNEKYNQLKLSEEMYRVAMSLTNHTISVVDIPTHTLNQIYNEGDWTGVSVSMEDVPESVLSTGIIHPDDHEGYREFYNQIYTGVPQGELTMRVMEENRGWVWFTMYFKTVFDSDGTPLRSICFSEDITVEKMAEEKYLQYKNAVTADAEFVWEADLTNDILIINDKNVNDIFGEQNFEKFSELSNHALEFISDPLLKEQAKIIFSKEGLLEAFDNAKREVSLEYPYCKNTDTEVRWMRAVAHLMINNVGNVMLILCSNDITETHERIKSLEKQAENDSLTGLFNRFSFEKRAREILENYPNSVHGFLMVDIDNFKTCNDTFGHAFGDSVLQLFAKVAKSVFRSSDLLGRVGGDEFMIVMRDAGNKETIERRAKQIQEIFKEEGNALKLPMNITLSIGVAVSDATDRYNDLYLRADNMMYKSKKSGKNLINVE